MKKQIVTCSLVVVAFAVNTGSQEGRSAHAQEVCNAQVNLWVAQTDVSMPYGPVIRKVMSTLTSKDISEREGLITDCLISDLKEIKAVAIQQRPAKAEQLGIRLDQIEQAQALLQLYSAEQRTRYFGFIVRHRLEPEFDEEDRAGER